MSLTVFSFGGGVQSTAALVLAAQGDLHADAFLFANVGDDSEWPETLRYVREVAMPYAHAHGVPLHELHRTRRDGSTETLYGRLTRPESRSIGIPVRLAGSGAPANRSCTADFKIRVTARWCWERGARPTQPATTMLGISREEAWRRMRLDSGISYTRLAYPLVDRRLTRMDCVNIIQRAGLPIPPKSSCWFCPFSPMERWRDLRDHRPDLFARAGDLEATLMARKRAISRRPNDGCYLTPRMVPLARAVGDAKQGRLFEDDACESGYCMT